MSMQQSDRRQRRVAFLASLVVLLALVAAAVVVIPMVRSKSVQADPGGPPSGSSSGSPSATGGPSESPKTKPSTSAKGKPSASAKDKPTESAKAPSVKPYNGSGKVPAVRSTHRTIDKSTATKVVETYVEAVPKIEPETKSVKTVVSDIAGAAVQQELTNQMAELDSNGWTLSGEPVIKSSSIVSKDLKSSPPTVTVKACVDSSDVVTLDHDGNPVGSGPDTKPAYNVYQLEQKSDGSWLLVSHTFPNNPTC